jgi:ferredoxin--NADP+ reductase
MNLSHLTTAEKQRLRDEHYNARVESVVRPHAGLMVMRVRPDCGIPEIRAGQYVVLALGNWESQIAEALPEAPPQRPSLIKRAYSISCSLLDERKFLVRINEAPYLEFYITLVPQPQATSPKLTPRLFLLSAGDRLYCARRAHGNYSLEHVQRSDDVVFAATGTGEAPHNAMLADLLAWGHRGKIVSTTCVRYRRDLAYLDVHRQLQQRYANYRYVPLTTREPENLDRASAGFVGKRYLQDYFTSGELQRETGIELKETGIHVFLCGNPAMIGVPRHTHDLTQRYPQPLGMVEVLERFGLRVDQPHEPGSIHFEKYW